MAGLEQELRVKVIADMEKLKADAKQVATMLGEIKIGSRTFASFGAKTGTPAKEGEDKKQADISGSILKALLAANIIWEGLEPILKPVLALIRILVLIIFLPLLPLFKIALVFLANMAKFILSTQGTAGGKAAGPAIAIEGLIGGIIGFLLGGPLGAIIGVLLGGLTGALGIRLGEMLGNVIKMIIDFLKTIDWNAIGIVLVELFSAIFTISGTIINAVLTGIFNALPQPLKNAWNTVIGAIKFGHDLVFGADGKSGVWGAISSALEWVKVVIFAKGGLWDDIQKALGDVVKFLADRWNDILTSLDTIVDALVRVKNAIDAIFGTGDKRPAPGSNQDVKGTINRFPNNGPFNLGPWGNPNDPLAKIQGNASGLQVSDFISRPGQGISRFSPGDTLLGMKNLNDLMSGNNVTYSPTYNIDANVDKAELLKIFKEHDKDVISKLRSYGTGGGRSLNV